MSKNTRNRKTISEIIEDRKALKELKRMNRAARPLVKDSDEAMLPKGWQNMTNKEIRLDAKRRAKENYHNKLKQPKDVINATFVFTMGEIGIPLPTEEELKIMQEINPRAAKRFKYFKPLKNTKSVTVKMVRDTSMTLKEQWAKERQLVKSHLIEQRLQAEQEILKSQGQIQYSPNGPTTLDLNNITSAESV